VLIKSVHTEQKFAFANKKNENILHKPSMVRNNVCEVKAMKPRADSPTTLEEESTDSLNFQATASLVAMDNSDNSISG